MRLPKTEAELKTAASALRRNLRVEFGNDRITENVEVYVEAKIQSKMLDAIDTAIENYSPRELAQFLGLWKAMAAEQVETATRQ